MVSLASVSTNAGKTAMAVLGAALCTVFMVTLVTAKPVSSTLLLQILTVYEQWWTCHIVLL